MLWISCPAFRPYLHRCACQRKQSNSTAPCILLCAHRMHQQQKSPSAGGPGRGAAAAHGAAAGLLCGLPPGEDPADGTWSVEARQRAWRAAAQLLEGLARCAGGCRMVRDWRERTLLAAAVYKWWSGVQPHRSASSLSKPDCCCRTEHAPLALPPSLPFAAPSPSLCPSPSPLPLPSSHRLMQAGPAPGLL